MRSKSFILIAAGLALATLLGCTFTLFSTPEPQPTLVIPTLTPMPATPVTPIGASPTGASPTAASPTATTTSATLPVPPTFTSTSPATVIPTTIPPTVSIITPAAPSGPYAVILVQPTDVLNIRSAPGANSAVVGSFTATSTSIQRSGASAKVGDSLWVEVIRPDGGRGWVNAKYLTEYIAPSQVCDPKAMTLLSNFERAITTSNGDLLASLVSPLHGVYVWLWRSGNAINFDQAHAKWVFESTYIHNWGEHPASGLETKGSFHEAVLPNLLAMYTDGHEIHCGERGVPGWNISAWPEEYTNINVYKILKPATPGVDLDWRIWLAGVEYVNGQPYLFALIHFQWVP